MITRRSAIKHYNCILEIPTHTLSFFLSSQKLEIANWNSFGLKFRENIFPLLRKVHTMSKIFMFFCIWKIIVHVKFVMCKIYGHFIVNVKKSKYFDIKMHHRTFFCCLALYMSCAGGTVWSSSSLSSASPAIFLLRPNEYSMDNCVPASSFASIPFSLLVGGAAKM